MVRINVGALMNKAQGSKESISIMEEMTFVPAYEFVLSEPFSCEVQLIKLRHEINLQMHDAKTAVQTICNRCLALFTCPISFPLAEREFIINLPQESLLEGEEVYYIDKGANQIRLDEMIREEILLHFPPIPVCSPSCKGLCDKCGTNLNKETCTCPATPPPTTLRSIS